MTDRLILAVCIGVVGTTLLTVARAIDRLHVRSRARWATRTGRFAEHYNESRSWLRSLSW